MTLGIGQSMGLLIMSLLAIIILLKILVIVHGQSRKFKDLESRLNMIEHSGDKPAANQQTTIRKQRKEG